MAKRITKNPQSKVPSKEPVKGKAEFPSVLMLSLLLGLLSFLVYANTLKNGFVLDDHVAIKDNHFVCEGISAIPRLLVTPYHEGWLPTYYDNLYRPLSLVMFAVEYQIFGMEPAPFHFMNVLLYAGCVVLLFLFLDRFFDRKKTAVAFIASLLFALHPIHTEVVANIKSRDELLSFFFAFLCLNVFLKYVQTGKPMQLLMGALCFLLSLLSKETTITFLAIIPLVFFYYRDENKKRSVYITAGIALASVIFLVARYSVLNYYHGNHITNTDMIENALANQSLSYESRMATAVLILGYYIKLLFIPHPLLCDYSYNSIPYVHFSDPLVLLSLGIYVFLAVFSIVRLVKYRRDPYAFGILFFLVTVFLFSNIPFLIGTTMAERFMFFGSVGFCLVCALAVERLLGRGVSAGITLLKDKKVWVVIIPVSLIYAGLTINRNVDWSDNFTLYKTDLDKSHNDSRLNYYVADYLLENNPYRGQNNNAQKQYIEDILPYLYKAISIYPDYLNAEIDLGVAYLDLARYDSCETHYMAALKLGPDELLTNRNLAGLYFVTKRYPQSIAFNKKVLHLQPQNVVTCANIALSYLYSAVYDSAIYYSYKAMAMDSRFNGSYEVLSSSYKATGSFDSLRKYEAVARVNNPGFKP